MKMQWTGRVVTDTRGDEGEGWITDEADVEIAAHEN